MEPRHRRITNPRVAEKVLPIAHSLLTPQGGPMRLEKRRRVRHGVRAEWDDLSANIGKLALSTGYPPAYPR